MARRQKRENAQTMQVMLSSAVRRLDGGRASYLRQSFIYLSLLVPSYAQSYVGGDLSNQAPYGLPSQAFASAISSPLANVGFPIRGYNTSIPAGAIDATAKDISGWSINIGVTTDVPLNGSRYGGIDQSQCIDATTLSIIPPAGIAGCDDNSWRVCAIVFTAGLGSAVLNDVQAIKTDGSCSALLPENCIQKLQADSVVAQAGGGRECSNLSIPDECAPYFAGTDGTAFKIKPIGGTAYRDRRSVFFAWGSEPRFKGNKPALAAATKPVWPVLLTWSHLNDTGEVHDSAGWLSCVNTQQSKEVAGGGSANGAVSRQKSVAAWAIPCTVGLAWLFLL